MADRICSDASDDPAGYGEEYFASSCGPIPYERSAHWLNFFSLIADQLIRSFRPRRVLDAGCAMGFLVEALWTRGVHAEGIDISPYAISRVRPDVRGQCRVGSVTDSLGGPYDLVTCIEVLEHLPPDQARRAVENLCLASDLVLFSSTPDDFSEPTHLNVRPSMYWLDLFAEFGFCPEVRFDASFIAPHAMLLRKAPPAEEDCRVTFSELLRYKTATIRSEATLSDLRQQLEQVREQQSSQARRLGEREADLHVSLLAMTARQQELSDLELALDRLRTDRDYELAEMRRQMAEERRLAAQRAAEIEKRAASLELRLEDSRKKVTEYAASIGAMAQENAKQEAALREIVSSPGWKAIARYRGWMQHLYRDRPWIYRTLEAMAGTLVRVSSGASARPGVAPVSPQGHLAPIPRDTSLVVESPMRIQLATTPAYQRWIEEQEPDPNALGAQRSSEKLLGYRPFFSIILPVYRVHLGMLRECLNSVRNQSYQQWELCVVSAAPEQKRQIELLREVARVDPRVKLLELTGNLGISGNSNAALANANGEFVVLLDHDDTLAPFALFEVAVCLQAEPAIDFLYSDHDYLDAKSGLRCDPLFKPDWSPEIMLSANYLTHLTVLRRTLVEAVGRFDPSTDGAQDWDLFLRVTENARSIRHISKILYHWRMHPASTARNSAAKSYAADAQLLAIGRHMERVGMEADPEVMVNGLLHARFRHAPRGLVSIVIPSKDKVGLLSRCISTLSELTSYRDFEIVIVDSGSHESATTDYYRSLAGNERIRIVPFFGEFNYSAANNRGAREARGEFLLFLNNDVEITNAEWLSELVSWASYPPVGIVGAKLLRANGTIQHAGVVLGLSGFADHPFADLPSLTFGMAGSTGWYRNYLAVTGACMMMRREVFEQLRGFDESFLLCGSDVEICLRASELNYRILYNPFAELIHHEQQTRGRDVPPLDYLRSYECYRKYLATGDPYWNLNLSLWHKEPSFQSPEEETSLAFVEAHIAALKQNGAEPSPVRQMNEEESIVSWFDCGEETFRRLREEADRSKGLRPVQRILWFLPEFQNAFYGGIYTILRFADSWSRGRNVLNMFAICASVDHRAMAGRIRTIVRDFSDSNLFILREPREAADLPRVDATICTLWTTAFYALHHRDTARRFYFIQDFEPAFYPAGSKSAIVESTYRMSLFGIANTAALRHMYESEYNGKCTEFIPCVNSDVFHAGQSNDLRRPGPPWQVVCYGRPRHGRNAFELLMAAMRKLKARLGHRVRILSAGGDWDVAEYGLSGVVENLGTLAYERTADLYRESHAGVVLMLTRHPSYIPLELMATGCLVVTNFNHWTDWLLKDKQNAILTAPTASAIADAVERGLLDEELRGEITANGLLTISRNHLDWQPQMDRVYQYMCDPESGAF